MQYFHREGEGLLIGMSNQNEKPGFDQNTLDSARSELVKLQAGDAENLGIWREMIRLSQSQFDAT